jgi:hypothetical protein
LISLDFTSAKSPACDVGSVVSLTPLYDIPLDPLTLLADSEFFDSFRPLYELFILDLEFALDLDRSPVVVEAIEI